MSIDYVIPFVFDSGSASAKNKTADGSQFSVYLEEPLIIPYNAEYCYLTVSDATCWYNIKNINEGVNDELHIAYDDGFTAHNVKLTFDAGLYDVDHLNAALLRLLINDDTIPSDIIIFIPDPASDKIHIQFNYPDTQVDFRDSTGPNIRDVLGFESRFVPNNPTTQLQYEVGDTEAAFNNIDYFTIGSDLVQRGLRINDKYYQTIAKIPITTELGHQNVYEPQNPPKIPCNELIGCNKKQITLWITNENLKRVNTDGQPFSASINLHYVIKDHKIINDY